MLPTPKELKKLAAACRKAGITSLEANGVKITISADAPEISTRKQKAAVPASNLDIETSGLSENEILFWSVTGLSDSTEKSES
jgi:hypothetical protein